MFAYIGRQAIYGKDLMIAGYELLYRSGARGNSVNIVDGDAATRAVLSEAVSVFGISQLTDGLPAFINFTRNLLLDDFAFLASPKDIIVEVPGNIEVDEALTKRLFALQRGGYRLALDSYNEMNGMLRFNDILPLFDIIRVDVSRGNRLQLSDIVRKLRPSRARLLAERIETEAHFDLAMSLDFYYFQGYYFEKPVRLSKQIPPLAESSYGRLLNELLRPQINFDLCADIIHGDDMMAYMFLRRVQNSTLYQGNSLTDIRKGMVVLGTDEMRHWVCLALMKQNNAARSDELPRRAYLRGRFIERLIDNADTEIESREGFLLGVFSLLDQVLGTQMETMLHGMYLRNALKAALLGREENEYSMFLQYVVISELGNPRLILPDIHLQITEKEVSRVYMSSIADTDAAFTENDPRTVRAYSGTILR